MPVERLDRSPQYIANQGYIDAKREITLIRRDRALGQTFVPTKEVLSLPDTTVNLEGDRHTISEIGSMSIEFLRSDELVEFLDGLTDANNLIIHVATYQLFRENEKYEQWWGILDRLPGGTEAYPNKTITMEFVTPAGAWLDGDAVVDPATGEPYVNKHVADTVLPALFAQAALIAPFTWDVEAPNVEAAAPFWSGIDRPKKYLARPNAGYDNTCRATALMYNGGKLYVGVHDAVTSGTVPWLVSYDPTTREWRKVCGIPYRGSKSFLKAPTEWELQTLQWGDGYARICGVARTNHENLLDEQAHYHSRFYVYPGFELFRRSAPIQMTVGTALPAGYTGLNLNVSALTFDTADISDCAIAYRSGDDWIEVDSAYLNVDGINKIWFWTPVAIPASTATTFRIFWGGLGRRKKSDLNNIFRYHHYCGDKINWTDYFAAFNVVAGEFMSAAAANFARTLNSDASGTPDHTVYAKCRATFTRAGVCIRGDSATGDTAVGYFDTVGNLLWIRYFQGAASIFNSSVAFVTAAGTNYRVKFSASGNTLDLWVSPDGTEITGVPDHTAITALGNTQLGPGFVAHNALQSYFDDLYKVDRVLNEPSCAVGATEKINGIYDDYLFTLHDKGQTIESKNISLDNRDAAGDPPTVDAVDYYGDMEMHTIGWGTPRHSVKECSIMMPRPTSGFRRSSVMIVNTGFAYGATSFRVYKSGNKALDPKVSDHCWVRETTNDYIQECGRITGIKDGGNYFEIAVENPSRYYYSITGTWDAYFVDSQFVPHDSVFVAEPQEVKIEYLFPQDIGSVDSEPVLIERRDKYEGNEDFYWPQRVLEVEESGRYLVDEIGYMSFSSVREMGLYAEDDAPPTGNPYKKYQSGAIAPFRITLKGYNPAYLIPDGFWVASALQNSKYGQPAPCRLIHDGETVRLKSGEELKTRGSIWLWKDGSTIWVAWNTHEQDVSGAWFSQCRVGKWNGSRVEVTWWDRGTSNWRSLPECYITSFIRFKNSHYFGRRYYERNFVDTTMRLFWAAPPQSDTSPRYYDGRLVAVGAVKGNKTDVLEEGALIRTHTRDNDLNIIAHYPKAYRIVDINAAPREITASAFLADGEDDYIGMITYFTILTLDAIVSGGDHNAQVGEELRGKYITLAVGRDARAEVAKL